MRIHVKYHGKLTTISVDDVLIDYLGAWSCLEQPEFHLDHRLQFKRVLEIVRKFVTFAESEDSNAPLSGRVQSLIIKLIAQDGLKDIVESRGPLQRPTKKAFTVPPEWKESPTSQTLMRASDPRQQD